MSVVTRFAPSPTGFLHIGGARTALFNYLFARHHGGKYLLRIEDTDTERSTDAALAAIHDGLGWLGLDGDGEVVRQSTRSDRHREIADELVARGAAYYCNLEGDKLKAAQDEARSTGKAFRSPCRDKNLAPEPGAKISVRLRMPDDGSTTIGDAVQGAVTVANETLDEFVLLRSDRTPTYMLAVVVDDSDMGVTHVIRGDDHLNNAFRQSKIIEALGWPVPQYAHIPLIHGSDGAKLSKRHGAISVSDYRDMGFLANAMCNYLLRLGWSHGDDEIISRDDAIKWFGLDAVGKSPARFDMDKLENINGHYIRAMPQNELTAAIVAGENLSGEIQKRIDRLAPVFAERATRITDLREAMSFAMSDDAPTVSDEAAALLTDEVKNHLKTLAADLPDDFADADAFKQWLNERLAPQGLKMRDIGPGLRAALTGMKQSPDIATIGFALGPAQARARINAVCK